MSNKIKHSGIVDSVEKGCVCVRIVQSSACTVCKVAAHCNASETKEKLVFVYIDNALDYRVGDTVVVATDISMGFWASFYGYLLPLILMVATLILVLQITKSEGMAALSAIGVLIPYYVGLYLLRSRISQKLRFEII